jgi:hypothetical protein
LGSATFPNTDEYPFGRMHSLYTCIIASGLSIVMYVDVVPFHPFKICSHDSSRNHLPVVRTPERPAHPIAFQNSRHQSHREGIREAVAPNKKTNASPAG